MNIEKVMNGINQGRPLCGPEHVVIDVTNVCNCNCSVCWMYSPFLKKTDKTHAKDEIDFYRLLDFVDECAAMGVKRIRFTGGGEPLVYEGIVEVIEAVKQQGIACALTTNMTKITCEMIDRFIYWGVDEIAASIWAATPETYSAVHPNKSEENFRFIESMLRYLTAQRTEKKPRLTLSNVLFSDNWHEFKKMHEFACDVGADAVYYTLADLMPGTEHFALDSEKAGKILQILDTLSEDSVAIENKDGFRTRLQGNTLNQGMYDADEIDAQPCYAGWIFARILANGDVCPCCRGVNKVMGNIHRNSFGEIWNNSNYQRFRKNAYELKKTDPYFTDIGCYTLCDNLMHNRSFHSLLQECR